MKPEARDLRDLAHALEETCRRSPAHSMAWESVMALSDYLQLRAHVIELHNMTQNELRHNLSPRGNHETPL